MPKLICLKGPGSGAEYRLSKDITTLGLLRSCDVQVPDACAHPVHCQIRRYGKLYSLLDLGSNSGTLVDGKRVGERLLGFGDRLVIGEAMFEYARAETSEVGFESLLNDYEVQQRLGEGAMGVVFKAVQRSSGRVVALKILAPKYSSRPRFIELFDHEAKAALTLDHPNIIRVYDAGRENGIHFFAMELVEGRTCQQEMLRHERMPLLDALRIAHQTALGLQHLHSRKLIHRDIKPDNLILVPDGPVKIVDFGVSAPIEESNESSARRTTAFRVAGTPFYLAPEMVEGLLVDHRADIYSLGATLYHLIAGRPPFTGDSAIEIVAAHFGKPVPPLIGLRPDVPSRVQAVVERMLAKKPCDRYPDAGALAADLAKLLHEPGVATDRTPRRQEVATEKVLRQRAWSLWTLLAADAVLAVIGGLVAWRLMT